MSDDQKDPVTAETAAETQAPVETAAETPAVETPAKPEKAEKAAKAPKGAKADKKDGKEAAAEGAPEADKTRRPSAAELLGEDLSPVKARKAKQSKNVAQGIVHVKATFNNTIVSVTDLSGNVISQGAAGGAGFKGSRKSTAYAGTVVAQEATRTAMSHGLKEAEVRIQGPGAGRESAVRAVQSCGVTVTAIKDVTPVPHNGCRPRKRRRV